MVGQSDPPLEQLTVLHDAVIEAGILQTYIGMLTTLTERAHLYVTQDGYEASATDPATVATVTTTLDRAGFDEFESQDIDFGLNLLRFDDMIGFGGQNELTNITYSSDPESLSVDLTGLQYTTGLEDPETIRSTPSIPDIDPVLTVHCKGKKLNQAIQAAELVGDTLWVNAEPEEETIRFSAEGDDDSMELRLSKDNDSIQDLTCAEEGGAAFDLNYLKDIRRSFTASTDLTVKCGNDAPMEISFTAADGTIETTYLIAPRVDV